MDKARRPVRPADAQGLTVDPCDLFADVSAGGLDQLAEAATELEAPPDGGCTEGDYADAFYVVADGRLGVTPQKRPPGRWPSKLGAGISSARSG